jgi:hypothetical protein
MSRPSPPPTPLPEADPRDDGRPRVLSVRFGANPNSSSLGVDVTYLLFGGAAVMGVSLVLSAWLRGRRPSAVEVVGQPAPEPRP